MPSIFLKVSTMPRNSVSSASRGSSGVLVSIVSVVGGPLRLGLVFWGDLGVRFGSMGIGSDGIPSGIGGCWLVSCEVV